VHGVCQVLHQQRDGALAGEHRRHAAAHKRHPVRVCVCVWTEHARVSA
jgi:hypothetical protein